MMKRLWMLMGMCALASVAACGDDSGGGGGGDGDASGEPLNLDCPDTVPPLEGPGGQHGACCYRGQSNSSRLAEFDAAATAGETETFLAGFRFNKNTAIRPLATMGAEPLPTLAQTRAENYEQMLMLRLGVPRKDGEFVAGEGTYEMGAGTYNCDGTFSFYGDGAAPVIDAADYPGSDSPDRWHYTKVPATFDPDASDRAYEVSFEERKAIGYSYTSFIETETDATKFTLDWEIVTQDLDILDFDFDEDNLDCYGERDGMVWTGSGRFEVYADMANNNDPVNSITAVGGINFCTLVSFGVGAAAMKPIPDCEVVERCLPGSDGCVWLALPDSLCPTSAAERDIFGCHVGDENNINDDDTQVVNCTQEAPTEHPTDNDGQCCDPLGQDPNLPACNAFRIVNEFVAASANITEALASEPLDKCPAE